MGKAKILYLDDEEDLLEFVKFVLERYGYDVIVGQKWEDKYLEELKDVDMAILDIMFPEEDIDGYGICKKIREQEEYKDLPIYMFSAKAFLEDKEEAKKAGASGFIEKPIPVEELVSLVNNVVEGKS